MELCSFIFCSCINSRLQVCVQKAVTTLLTRDKENEAHQRFQTLSTVHVGATAVRCLNAGPLHFFITHKTSVVVVVVVVVTVPALLLLLQYLLCCCCYSTCFAVVVAVVVVTVPALLLLLLLLLQYLLCCCCCCC